MSLRPGGVPQWRVDRTRSTHQFQREYPLDAASNYTQEGDCAIMTTDTGVSEIVLSQSGGVAKEKFVGVMISDALRVTDLTEVESTVVPGAAPFTFQLSKQVPSATHISIYDAAGTKLTLVGGAPAAINEFSISGRTVTFHAAKANAVIPIIRYMYTPTVIELQAMMHQRPQVLAGQSFINQVAIWCGICRIFTMSYLQEDDFTLTGAVYTGAGGKFTTTNTSVQVAGVCVSVPSVGDPFLGVEYNVTPGALQW